MSKKKLFPVLLLAGLSGCSWFGAKKPKPLPAEAFFAAGHSMDPTTGRQPLTTAPTDQLIAHSRAATRPVSRLAKSPKRSPTSRPISLGEYMTLGGVLVQVNGIPIYANRVIREIAPALEANARVMDPEEYRNAAQKLIEDQTRVLVNTELEFAAAQRYLEDRDKQLADALTTEWRQHQITEAGGSLELARQRAVEIAHQNNMPDDLNFEQLVQQKYREYMIRLWVQRKIKPRVEVTQYEMREFYHRHLSDMFTQHAEARFRMIRIDPADTGGREQALAKIRRIREQAVNGVDFESLARKFNDSKNLMAKGGDVGWVQKGAFVLDKVEQAVWSTPPGHITPIVEDQGGFYIAEVTATKDGHVQSFDNQDVQEQIVRLIEGERTQQILQKVSDELRKNAMFSDEDMDSALEMAMQAYPRWSKQANAD